MPHLMYHLRIPPPGPPRRTITRPVTSMRRRLLTKEEFARRGTELYEREIRPRVEQGNHGKIVAIDIETGAFEVADDVLAASDRLLARRPDAQTWLVRIGHRAVHCFGKHRISTSP